MIISQKTTLEDQIIEILSGTGGVSAMIIKKVIDEHHGGSTLQGIYRVLRKLQDESVVVKEKQGYSLRISWVMRMIEFGERLEKNYIKASYISDLVPEGETKHTWRFTQIQKMMQFRYQLLSALAKNNPESNCLSYSPHLWQILVDKDQELHFEENFLSQIKNSFVVIGNRTYLDQFIYSVLKDSYTNKHFYLAFPDEKIEKDYLKAVDIIGDYIVTTKYSKDIFSRIEKMFYCTKPTEDIDSLDILPICTRGAKVKITIAKDPKKAKMYRKRFVSLFGPLERW